MRRGRLTESIPTVGRLTPATSADFAYIALMASTCNPLIHPGYVATGRPDYWAADRDSVAKEGARQ